MIIEEINELLDELEITEKEKIMFLAFRIWDRYYQLYPVLSEKERYKLWARINYKISLYVE